MNGGVKIPLAGTAAIALAAGLMGAAVGTQVNRPAPVVISNSGPEDQPLLRVQITGAVDKPGVYSFPSGTRIEDALAAAGGAAPAAQLDGINLAAKLTDEQLLEIPSRTSSIAPLISSETQKAPAIGEAKKASSSASKPKPSSTSIVSINSATMEQLDTLPGVGPAIAKRIIEFRKAHNGFRSVEDLLEVKGIGPKTLEKMRSRIRL